MSNATGCQRPLTIDSIATTVPDRAHGRQPIPDQDRRAVDDQAVDEIGGEEGGRGRRAALDQQIVDSFQLVNALGRVEVLPSRRRVAASEQRAARRAVLQAGDSHVERRIVRFERPASHQDHVAARALPMRVGAGFLAGNPSAFAGGRGNLAVERHGELQCDIGPAEPLARQEACQRAGGRSRARSNIDCNAGRTEQVKAGAVSARIRIAQGGNDPRQLRIHYRHRTGRSARAFMRAGLECYIVRRPTRLLAGCGQRDCFGMGPSTGFGRAFGNERTTPDDHTADVGIGSGGAAGLLAEGDGPRHPLLIGHI